jgi:hypothetical protein
MVLHRVRVACLDWLTLLPCYTRSSGFRTTPRIPHPRRTTPARSVEIGPIFDGRTVQGSVRPCLLVPGRTCLEFDVEQRFLTLFRR